MAPGKAELKARVCAEIERRKGEIMAISEHIMKHPEPGYREVRTAEFVAGWFRKMGLEAREGLALTGVKTRIRGRSRGPTVAVLGELDSLIVGEHPRRPDHPRGPRVRPQRPGGVDDRRRHGAPGRHGRARRRRGPVRRARRGVHRGGVASRPSRAGEGRVHRGQGRADQARGVRRRRHVIDHAHNARPEDGLASVGRHAQRLRGEVMRFMGKGAHAGSAPHLGINALKAARSRSRDRRQRETFRDEDRIRVHPIITRGGEAVSAMPADVRLETFVRGKTVEAIRTRQKVDRSLRAGAPRWGRGCRSRRSRLPAAADRPEPRGPRVRQLRRGRRQGHMGRRAT